MNDVIIVNASHPFLKMPTAIRLHCSLSRILEPLCRCPDL